MSHGLLHTGTSPERSRSFNKLFSSPTGSERSGNALCPGYVHHRRFFLPYGSRPSPGLKRTAKPRLRTGIKPAIFGLVVLCFFEALHSATRPFLSSCIFACPGKRFFNRAMPVVDGSDGPTRRFRGIKNVKTIYRNHDFVDTACLLIGICISVWNN